MELRNSAPVPYNRGAPSPRRLGLFASCAPEICCSYRGARLCPQRKLASENSYKKIWTSTTSRTSTHVFSDVGVSSVDAIAFFKLINQEFNLGLVAEECSQFETLRQLCEFIDARGS